ncbi:Transcriptional regulatory protein TyrR [compost metagenome]
MELAGTALGNRQGEAAPVTSLEDAVQAFEKDLLQRLYAEFPSTRQLAARLNTSHTAIGQRLRKYGISRD